MGEKSWNDFPETSDGQAGTSEEGSQHIIFLVGACNFYANPAMCIFITMAPKETMKNEGEKKNSKSNPHTAASRKQTIASAFQGSGPRCLICVYVCAC